MTTSVTQVLSLENGSVPPWFVARSGPQPRYIGVAEAVLMYGATEDRDDLTAFDSSGTKLWTRTLDHLAIGGNRLFLYNSCTHGDDCRLTEVEPLSGAVVGKREFTGQFFGITATKAGQLVTIGAEKVTFLDENLERVTSIDSDDPSLLAEGDEQFFVAVDTDPNAMAEKVSLTAVSTEDLSIAWTLDLEARHFVEQMGRHLVVRERTDNTIHGLGTP